MNAYATTPRKRNKSSEVAVPPSVAGPSETSRSSAKAADQNVPIHDHF